MKSEKAKKKINLKQSKMIYFQIKISIILLIFSSIIVSSSDYEQKIIEKIFKNYNRRLKPSGVVEVKFAVHLNQIINLIEKEQNIILNVFIDHEWIDTRLKWNATDFKNITTIRVSSDYIWTPDTFIYTTADRSGYLLPYSGVYILINNFGRIFWPIPSTYMKLRCRMKIFWYPFDEQVCVIIFGSWTHTIKHLNYTLMLPDPIMINYTENNEWQLVQYKPFRSEMTYEQWIEEYPFSEIRYKLWIKRKSLFTIQNFVTPAIFLCFLTLVSFFIPFAQEMQIGISILLSFAVFKLRLSDDVPVQSESIPLINVYFILCILYSLSSMVWFSLLNNLKEQKPLSNFFRQFLIQYVCFLMCIRTNNKNDTNKDKINKQLNKIRKPSEVWIKISESN